MKRRQPELCSVCDDAPVAVWGDAPQVAYPLPAAPHEAVSLFGYQDVCIGCAASNFEELDCRVCRNVVAAILGGVP